MNQGVESVEYLRRLRELCDPDRWDKVREFYLSQHSRLKPEVYSEEKLFSKLIESLTGQPIEVIDRYRDEVKDLYPKQILDLYLDYLEELTQHPNNAAYNKMEDYLLMTASLKGGKQSVLQLIERWKKDYPNRKAMRKMLDRVQNRIEHGRT